MWVESVLVVGDQIADAAELDGWVLTAGTLDDARSRMLLAHVTTTEDQLGCTAYSALTIVALQGDAATHLGVLDLARPLLVLGPHEQQALRAWLIARSWPAWARAALCVRAIVGETEPPVLLAEAARQWMLSLATLSGAASAERLPTIRMGDRHMVYSATICEAQQRGVLQLQRGRPRRRA